MDVIQRMAGGKKGAFALMEMATDDVEAQQIVAAWRKIANMPGDTFEGGYARGGGRISDVDLDLVLEACGMTARWFVGILARCGYDFGVDGNRLIVASYLPAMAEASMKRALEPDATREREIHFAAIGHLPTSKGVQIAIANSNRNSLDHDPEEGEATPFSRTARRVVRNLPN